MIIVYTQRRVMRTRAPRSGTEVSLATITSPWDRGRPARLLPEPRGGLGEIGSIGTGPPEAMVAFVDEPLRLSLAPRGRRRGSR